MWRWVNSRMFENIGTCLLLFLFLLQLEPRQLNRLRHEYSVLYNSSLCLGIISRIIEEMYQQTRVGKCHLVWLHTEDFPGERGKVPHYCLTWWNHRQEDEKRSWSTVGYRNEKKMMERREEKISDQWSLILMYIHSLVIKPGRRDQSFV